MQLQISDSPQHRCANMLIHLYEAIDAAEGPKATQIASAEFKGATKALDRLNLAPTDTAVHMAVMDELRAGPPKPPFRVVGNDAQQSWYFDRALGVMARLGWDTMPPNRVKVIYAYPGDSLDEFPFVATHWFAQSGNQWMAVAEWENEAMWFDEDETDWTPPTPRIYTIDQCPPSGHIVYRDETGQDYHQPVEFLRASIQTARLISATAETT